MPSFSEESKKQLSTCDVRLQKLFNEVIKVWDCKVTEGHRGEKAQNDAYDKGYSKLRWPNGNHNSFPSKAVDVYPFPIDYKDTKRFYHFAGIVLGIASQMNLTIRWGGNWDQDYDLNDNGFQDLVHFEVKD